MIDGWGAPEWRASAARHSRFEIAGPTWLPAIDPRFALPLTYYCTPHGEQCSAEGGLLFALQPVAPRLRICGEFLLCDAAELSVGGARNLFVFALDLVNLRVVLEQLEQHVVRVLAPL